METQDQTPSLSSEAQGREPGAESSSFERRSLASLGLGAAALAALVLGLLVVAVSTLRDSADPFSWLRGKGSAQVGGGLGQPGITPAFQLPDATGQVVSSGEWSGTPVILHFWASWCAPCIDEIPKILGAARALQDLPIRWVFISLDHRWADAEKILSSQKLRAELSKAVLLLDDSQKVSEAFGSFQFPETYLFDSKGQRLSKWVGPQTWESPELLRAFRDRFGGPVPSPSGAGRRTK